MTEREEKQALFWIKRWKMVGGCFTVALDETPQVRQLSVQIERQPMPNPKDDVAAYRAAQALAAELTKNPKKHLHIGELVRDAWVRNNPSEATVEMAVQAPVPANDAGPPKPAA